MTWTLSAEVRTWRCPSARDPDEALGLATTTLAAVGFTVTPVERGVDATGPQRRGTKESPLLGLGRLELRLEGADWVARTDLSGGRTLVRFAQWFAPALSLGLALVFAALGAVGGLGADLAFDVGSWGFAGLGVAAPALLIGLAWLPIGAWMARGIREAHEGAVRALLATIAGNPVDAVHEATG